MKPLSDCRTILLVEDDDFYIKRLVKIYQDALSPLRISNVEDKDTDVILVVAKTLEEAKNTLANRKVYLTTVDINLRGEKYKGQAAEGMEILKEIDNLYPTVCPIVVSSEEPSLHMRKALLEYKAIDYIQKSELRPQRTELIKKIKNLLKTTFVYSEAMRLFDKRLWSQAELVWQTITKDNPDFVKVNDRRNLGEQLDEKKSDVTNLPGREWVWAELDSLRKDMSRSDWAIILVSIESFKSFHDRSLKEGEDVLKLVAHQLKNIVDQAISDSFPSISDILLQFQQSNKEKIVEGVFLGEIENTGRFLLVTPSVQIAEDIKEMIEARLTPEIFKTFYRFKEQEAGYVIVNDQKVDLMSVITEIRTCDDIMGADGIDNGRIPLPIDVFESRMFEYHLNDATPENQILSETSRDDNDRKKKRRFPFS
ncbi:MAG: hypothetical protein FOGNACKC_01960 [Anaerolineae bacterium]|nr:hypothetical protein [Anaerolineae bacterium]